MNKDEVIDLIRDAGFGMFATSDGSQPRVRPMMPYLTEDNRVLLATLGRSRSIKQVEKNPLVEICFVDRKMWYCRITGQAKLSTSAADKQILWDNIPMLKQYFGGITDPNFVLLEVKILGEVEAMTPHQKTPEKIALN